MDTGAVLQMFTCLCILFYCSSLRPVQGLPLKPRMKSSNSRNRNTNDAYSETLNDIMSFPSIDVALLNRKPRNLNAILRKPTATRNGRLQSRSGKHFLKISSNGHVGGSSDVCSPYALLQLQTYNRTLKRIMGVKSGLYLAINARGRLYTTDNKSGSGNTFLESLFVETHEQSDFLTYSSSQYPRGNNGTWLIALKRNGLVKKPSRTKIGMDSTQFTFVGEHNINCKQS